MWNQAIEIHTFNYIKCKHKRGTENHTAAKQIYALNVCLVYFSTFRYICVVHVYRKWHSSSIGHHFWGSPVMRNGITGSGGKCLNTIVCCRFIRCFTLKSHYMWSEGHICSSFWDVGQFPIVNFKSQSWIP